MNSPINAFFYPEKNTRDGRLNLFSSYPDFSLTTERLMEKYQLCNLENISVFKFVRDVNVIINSEYIEKKKLKRLLNQISKDKKKIQSLEYKNKTLNKEYTEVKKILKILRINTSKSYRELYSNGGNKNGK